LVTTDAQVEGLFKRMSEGKPLYVSAQKSGMCEKTARKYFSSNRFPSDLKRDRDWATRRDPFSNVWAQVEEKLADDHRLEAKTAFEWLQQQYPGRFRHGQLRTLQRRFHQWRALHGDAKETFFPQDHHPGELGASDFTWMTDLGIMIAGAPFDHLLYHYVLTWSNWEHGTVCFSESYESLSTGLQNAWWRCGGVPEKHRTDRLSAAVNNLDEKRSLTVRCDAQLRHYDVAGQKTNPNSGNENGDVEQRHHRIERAVEQALILRCSRDFATRAEYERFLDELFDRLNAGREKMFEEERRFLRPLPARRLPDYTELREVRENFEQKAQQALQEQSSPLTYPRELLELECVQRREKSVLRRLHESGLPLEKTSTPFRPNFFPESLHTRSRFCGKGRSWTGVRMFWPSAVRVPANPSFWPHWAKSW